jgi:ComF family protein
LFGGTCFLCRGAASRLLCAACDADLPHLSELRCPRCALESPRGEVCGRCLAERPDYDGTRAALAYEFPSDALVHALKFRGELALAGLLGGVLAKVVAAEEVDCVVPVPLSAERLQRRGYNHAAEIARHVARRISNLPVELELCVRRRDTPPQMELPFAERQRNVRGAFRCTRSALGRRIAVVDDVMTTGATLNEIASVLKAAGASRVVNWVVARTL